MPALLPAIFLGLWSPQALAIEVEQGVTPEQRERVRLSLTMRRPGQEGVLLRMAGSAMGQGSEGTVVFSSWEQVCDLPCTIRVSPRSEALMVSGQGWSVPLRMHRYEGRDIDLVVRRGRPGLFMSGLLLTSIASTLGIIGGTFLLMDYAIGGAEEGMGAGWRRAGRIGAIGGVAGTTLGIGLMVRGSGRARQRRR
ncbi:MAG: hypothetical protein EA397_14920 [Deltaproteobacteria bacterium]|nr:MAG: hypothetical protein EA397_14920 [Deltaproteobacteria bacterium]